MAVIIVIGLVAMLAVTCMYMSYANYVMKMTEMKAKDNFYSAEVVLDQINTGLQSNVSTALETAYAKAAQTMTGSTTDAVRLAFRADYLSSLINQLSTSTDTSRYEIGQYEAGVVCTGFYQYLDNALLEMVENAKQATPDKTKGQLKLFAEGNANVMMTTEEGLLIRNFVIEFTDAEGYFSKIQTDIRITYPDISMGQQSNFPDIENYCIIADNGVEMKNGNTGDNKLIGNIYAGNRDEETLKKDPTATDQLVSSTSLYGLSILEDTNLSFGSAGSGNADIIVRGGLHINTEIVGSSNLGTKVKMDKVNLWTDSIEMNSSVFQVLDENSSTYVQDDMTIIGKQNQVKMEGSYIGYGDGADYLSDSYGAAVDMADYSSAIVVNCKDSEIHFGDVKNMFIAGNAYINPSTNARLSYYSETLDGEDDAINNILVGNSLALKSDQLAYLIPRSCIGVYNGTTVINKNPMTADEYQKWLQYAEVGNAGTNLDPDKYVKVDFSKTKEAIGIDMRDYAGYGYQVVKEDKASGSLYYVYATFDAVASAKYFSDYSAIADANLRKYAYKYQNEVVLPASDEKVNTMGNVLSVALGTDVNTSVFSMYSYAIADLSDIATMNTESQIYAKRYQSMRSLMTTSTTVDDPSQLANTVYQNTIDETGFPSGEMTYANETGIKAVVVNNKGGAAYTLSGDSDVALVLATGDVVIDQNLDGLVIAGGHVKVTAGHSVTSSPARVQGALSAPTPDGIVASSYFVNGSSYKANLTASSSAVSYTNTKDLIAYENWKKE